MSDTITIRMATESDANDLRAIYAPYVTDTAVTFEYSVPTIEQFSERIRKTLERYPYLVAVDDDGIVGYAYASIFKDRAAYDWCVEVTVYVKQECHGMGIGKQLYAALEHALKKQNIVNVYACVSSANPRSIGFHERMGYTVAARYTQCGYKFDVWHDVIWMEKAISDHVVHPKPFIPITMM
ncbi:MAG: N-acetyltransferase [Actinobacteria bacterium]|nr:N-acetyltransferase [Actinomycetota bacterium]